MARPPCLSPSTKVAVRGAVHGRVLTHLLSRLSRLLLSRRRPTPPRPRACIPPRPIPAVRSPRTSHAYVLGPRCSVAPSSAPSSHPLCWNPGTWVPKVGPITQGPIIGTEYIGTLIWSPSLIYGRGFTMAIISNNICNMLIDFFVSNRTSPSCLGKRS